MYKITRKLFNAQLIYLLLIFTALLACGPIYQSVAMRYDLQHISMSGKLIDIGGYRLHLYCIGQRINSNPIVILEGGIGAPSLMWDLVQSSVAEEMRVCSYDRAGYGWSDPSPTSRTANQIASELHNLLQQAGEEPPYILIGHSFGGIVVRIYAAEYPTDVSGIILADARHEDFFERMPPEYLVLDKKNLQHAKQLKLTTPLGITRFAGMTGSLDAFEAYLSPLQNDIEREAWSLMIYNPKHWSTAVAERESIEESYRQVKLTSLPQDLPLVVLTAENGIEAWNSSESPINDKAKATWMQMQRELSQLSSQSQWIIIKNSGHYIYFDQPDAIINAALSLLER